MTSRILIISLEMHVPTLESFDLVARTAAWTKLFFFVRLTRGYQTYSYMQYFICCKYQDNF